MLGVVGHSSPSGAPAASSHVELPSPHPASGVLVRPIPQQPSPVRVRLWKIAVLRWKWNIGSLGAYCVWFGSQSVFTWSKYCQLLSLLQCNLDHLDLVYPELQLSRLAGDQQIHYYTCTEGVADSLLWVWWWIKQWATMVRQTCLGQNWLAMCFSEHCWANQVEM